MIPRSSFTSEQHPQSHPPHSNKLLFLVESSSNPFMSQKSPTDQLSSQVLPSDSFQSFNQQSPTPHFYPNQNSSPKITHKNEKKLKPENSFAFHASQIIQGNLQNHPDSVSQHKKYSEPNIQNQNTNASILKNQYENIPIIQKDHQAVQNIPEHQNRINSPHFVTRRENLSLSPNHKIEDNINLNFKPESLKKLCSLIKHEQKALKRKIKKQDKILELLSPKNGLPSKNISAIHFSTNKHTPSSASKHTPNSANKHISDSANKHISDSVNKRAPDSTNKHAPGSTNEHTPGSKNKSTHKPHYIQFKKNTNSLPDSHSNLDPSKQTQISKHNQNYTLFHQSNNPPIPSKIYYQKVSQIRNKIQNKIPNKNSGSFGKHRSPHRAINLDSASQVDPNLLQNDTRHLQTLYSILLSDSQVLPDLHSLHHSPDKYKSKGKRNTLKNSLPLHPEISIKSHLPKKGRCLSRIKSADSEKTYNLDSIASSEFIYPQLFGGCRSSEKPNPTQPVQSPSHSKDRPLFKPQIAKGFPMGVFGSPK